MTKPDIYEPKKSDQTPNKRLSSCNLVRRQKHLSGCQRCYKGLFMAYKLLTKHNIYSKASRSIKKRCVQMRTSLLRVQHNDERYLRVAQNYAGLAENSTDLLS